MGGGEGGRKRDRKGRYDEKEGDSKKMTETAGKKRQAKAKNGGVGSSWWEMVAEEENEEWKEVKRKKKDDKSAREQRRKRWLEEREERLWRKRRRGEEERERKLEEEKKKKEKNVVWRDLDDDNEEERLWLAEEILEKTLKREVGIRGVKERKGEGGRWVVIMELERKKDQEEVIEKREEIGRFWKIGVDEDLTMKERKKRWRMVGTARRERANRRRVEVSNRELRVEGKRWIWIKGRNSWEEAEEEKIR